MLGQPSSYPDGGPIWLKDSRIASLAAETLEARTSRVSPLRFPGLGGAAQPCSCCTAAIWRLIISSANRQAEGLLHKVVYPTPHAPSRCVRIRVSNHEFRSDWQSKRRIRALLPDYCLQKSDHGHHRRDPVRLRHRPHARQSADLRRPATNQRLRATSCTPPEILVDRAHRAAGRRRPHITATIQFALRNSQARPVPT